MSVWNVLKTVVNGLVVLMKEIVESAEANQERRQATRMRLNQKDDRKLAEMVRDDGWFSPSQEEKAIAVNILKKRKAKREAAEDR